MLTRRLVFGLAILGLGSFSPACSGGNGTADSGVDAIIDANGDAPIDAPIDAHSIEAEPEPFVVDGVVKPITRYLCAQAGPDYEVNGINQLSPLSNVRALFRTTGAPPPGDYVST